MSIVRCLGVNPFSVLVIPALADNYSYLVIDENTGHSMAVDPVEPKKIIDAIRQREGVHLTSIATTHHHSDHAGGNVELIETFPSAVVYGFDTRIPALTKALRDGESFTLGKLRVQAIHNPCHTTGSLSYVIHDDNMEATEQAVFTGDTLFMAGCGRFFEGTAADMYEALYKRLGRLSPSTKVFVGHEYTIKNLEFATYVEPDNPDVLAKLESLRKDRSLKGSIISVPSTIELEWKINPFMRLSY